MGLGVLALTGGRILPTWAGETKPAATAFPHCAPYPYHGRQFTRFVSESCAYLGSGSPGDFYKWFESAYQQARFPIGSNPGLGLLDALSAEKQELSGISDRSQRAAAEAELGARVTQARKENYNPLQPGSWIRVLQRRQIRRTAVLSAVSADSRLASESRRKCRSGNGLQEHPGSGDQ